VNVEAGTGTDAGAGGGMGWVSYSPAKPPELMNPIALAYLGDAIYEVFIRQYVLSKLNHRPNHLHKLTTKYVSAKAQARLLNDWLPHLSEEEADVVKRGRNAKSGSAPKNADVLEYRQSTAFECLIGYLYYKGRTERLDELLARVVRES
jgi:ribonuclease III family protein